MSNSVARKRSANGSSLHLLGPAAFLIICGYTARTSVIEPTIQPKPDVTVRVVQEKPKKVIYRTASVYSDCNDGRRMSSGDVFYQSSMTVASELKNGTRVRLSYKGRSVGAVVLDKTHRRFYFKRIDCSLAVYRRLDPSVKRSKDGGLLKNVKVEVLER